MPQRRKDCGVPRGASQWTPGQPRGAAPPLAQDKLPKHQVTDECHTGDSGSGSDGGNSDTSEDLLDGTTRQYPLGTPPSRTTPPHNTTPSLYTSGHTQCRTRPNTSPPKEKAKHDIPEPEEVSNKQHHQGPTPALLILIVLLIIVGIYSLHEALGKAHEEKLKPPPKLISDVYADLKFELQGLSREFSQPKGVWLGLLGQLESVMVDEPQQPAIVMFVVPDDSKGTATCLAHRLARAIQYAFEDSQFVMFDTRSSEHLDMSALLKVELDESLRKLSEAHTAVIHNVENIPGPAAMILHAYCDNENAPYKQAIIILLAEIPGTYKELGYSRRLDSLVDSHLGRLWGAGLAEKDVSALVSRTCNTPILIRPERPARVLEICPL